MTDLHQAGLFDAIEHEEEERQHMEYWRICWNWDGPEAGGLCQIDTIGTQTEDGRTIYAYCEQCRLIERLPDGRWLAEIEMDDQDGVPWIKNGTRVVLEITDIWPPTRQLRDRRAGHG